MNRSVTCIFVFSLIALMGCGAKSSVACVECADSACVDRTEINGVRFHTISVADSVTCPEACALVARCQFVWPEGESLLADSVRAWVRDVITRREWTVTVSPDCMGTDMARQAIASLFKKEQAEMQADMEDGYRTGTDHSIDISVVYSSENYVTLECETYGYMGGAHGYATKFGATFDVATGRQMGWELLADKTPAQIRQGIRAGLKKYFDTDSDDEVRGLLFGSSDFSMSEEEYRVIPMPQTAPYLMPDGVHLVYQQYEICCYAAGMPEVVLR